MWNFIQMLQWELGCCLARMLKECFQIPGPVKCLRDTVAKKKPVLIIKGGSGGGAETAISHTASLAGSHEAFKACCDQAGFYLVEDLTEDPKILVNVLSILTSQPKTDNNKVAVISVGGGAGILLSDQVTGEGMQLAEFTPQTRSQLKELIKKNLKLEQESHQDIILKNVGNNPIDLLGNFERLNCLKQKEGYQSY